MKKIIIIVSGILQFIAAVSFFAIIRIAIRGAVGLEFYVILGLAIVTQIISSYLKQKYPNESNKANEIVNTPKNKYGWFALAFFGLVIVFFIIVANSNY